MCFHRFVAALLLALLLAPPVLADSQSDAVKLYKRELSRVVARQRRWEAKGLDEDLRKANETYIAPWRQSGGPDAPKVIDYDFSGYDAVYERWLDYEDEKGKLAAALAEAEDPSSRGSKVAERLFDTLLDTLTEIQREDQALLQSKVKTRGIHDLVPGMKRYGAWLHRDMLVQALRTLEDPHFYLEKKAFSKAGKWDRGRKSVRARVALIDAMGHSGSSYGLFLESQTRDEDPRIRIAAIEAMFAIRQDAPVKDRARELAKDDPCRPVRVAAKALLGEGKEEIPEGAPTFCGLPIASQRVILVLQASRGMVKPVDVDLLKTRTYREWRAVAERDRDWLSQLDLGKIEARAFVNALPETARFDLVLLNEADRALPLDERGMVRADARGKRRASDFLDAILAGGWAPQLDGIWAACRIAGADPFGAGLAEAIAADTIVLYSNGVPSGGRLLYAPAIIDDVRRGFRFHRMRIDTVRVDDCAAPAEELMKGIAEATGGTYLHRTKP